MHITLGPSVEIFIKIKSWDKLIKLMNRIFLEFNQRLVQHWQRYRSQKLTGIICKVHRTWNTYNCLKASMKVVILQRSRVQVTVPKVFQSRNLGMRLLRAASRWGGAGAAPSSANQTCKRCLTRSRLFIFTLLL